MTDDEEWGWDPDDIRPLTADEWRAVRALLPDLEQLVGDEWASRPPLNDRGWPDEDDLAESPWFRLHLSCGKKGHPEVMTATWPCGDGSWLFADYPNVATIHGKPAPRVVTLTMDKEPGDDDPLVDDELGYYPLWGAFLNEVTRDGWRAYLAEYQRTGGRLSPDYDEVRQWCIRRLFEHRDWWHDEGYPIGLRRPFEPHSRDGVRWKYVLRCPDCSSMVNAGKDLFEDAVVAIAKAGVHSATFGQVDWVIRHLSNGCHA
ncbi:MAG: hypothetical protein E7G15_07410 [Cutibacterium avidum]|nr:hypothetical protein [Cutibacterium avidum]MDU5300063.1 hypothetical protein [Cutibacterium avidum]MDU5867442.1 hypothetical protein [Cutibacterium avidum]MDU8016182.1 hypothetical protein [Cutibacterium avidum]